MFNTSCSLIRASIVTAAALWMMPPPLFAQSSSWSAHVTAIATISIQPDDAPPGGPYLDRGISATRPGLTAGFGVGSSRSPFIASVELSTTGAMETVQRGRFIPGLGPAVGRHRDTLLSILPGVRWRAGGGSMEVKAGPSFRFGEPTQAGEPVQDFSAGDYALTMGFDAVFPLNDRLGLIPSFRYSLTQRGDNDNPINYAGLGKHITRVGVGLRIRL